jgi:hypothetical protein
VADQIDYAPIIADLERRAEEILRTIATLRALASSPTDGPNSPPASTAPTARASHHGSDLRRDQFFGMKAPDAVKAYLAFVKQPRSAARIASDLIDHGFTTSSASPPNSIRTTLKRLEEMGEVVQIKKDWGLIDWYPGLRNKRGKGTEPNGTHEREPKAPARKASPRPIPKKAKAGGIDYRAFIAERMKRGMSMADAAAEWKIEKAQQGA